MARAKTTKPRAKSKKPIGRPTKYTKAMVWKVDKYLQENIDTYLDYEKTVWEKSMSYQRFIIVNLPSKAKFAKYLGIARSTLQLREEKHKDFSVALSDIEEEQKQRLIDNWLSGDYNPTIAKLILSANHWMNEKSEVKNEVEHSIKWVLNDIIN